MVEKQDIVSISVLALIIVLVVWFVTKVVG